MKSIQTYIHEELTDKEKGGNILIDKTKDYCLYYGAHVKNDRIHRHSEKTYNPGDDFTISQLKNTVNQGFYHIENCLSNNKLVINNPDKAICLVNKRYTPYLNVICFVKKLEIDGTLDIIIKTAMFKNDYKSDVKRIIESNDVELLVIDIND